MLNRLMLLFVVVVATGSLFAANAPVAVKPRIIDGTNVPDSQFPTIGIISDSTGSFICTGTLIAPRFVLTAAHCAVDGSTGEINIGQTGGRFMLGGITYSTAHVYVHPTYHGDNSQDVEGAVDLCIFELTRNVTGVTPSPLNRQVPTVGTQLTLAGYGEQGTGSTGTNHSLPKAGTINTGTNNIDVLTSTFIKWHFDNVQPPNQESNTAPGDSGGPQFITDGGVLFIASVTSGGSKANAGFGDFSYNTRVDIATAWIDSLTGGVTVAGNTPPTIGSASFSPSPTMSGQAVTFTVTAIDPNGDTLNYHWIFGDGTEDVNGSDNEMHTYIVDGPYTAQVIVTDGKGGSVEKDFSVTVGTGPGTTPVIASLVVKDRFILNFHTPGHSMLDFTLFNGAFLFTDKLSFLNAFDGSAVNVYVGSTLIDTFTLHGTRGVGQGTLTFTFRTGNVRYQVRNNANLVTALGPFGAIDNTIMRSVTLPLRIEFDGVRYGGDGQFFYNAKQGKTGVGK